MKRFLKEVVINNRINQFSKNFRENYQLYIMLLPGLILLFVFKYIPLYGITLAFKEYNPMLGILGSPWVGLKYFQQFFESPDFWQLMQNTIILSAMALVAGFIAPIILALLINQVRSVGLKKNIQLIVYAPNFISVVIVVGMLFIFLSPVGPVNSLITSKGFKEIPFMTSAEYFRDVYVWSGVWQVTGWGSIIYLAALSNVNEELIEAAKLDGASLLQRIRYIELPTIKPIAVILLILSAGSLMSIGFEKVYLMQTSLNMATSEILPTYIYKQGLLMNNYSYSTAIGLFNSAINLVLLIGVNMVVKKLNEGEGL
ncbi:ABC transporter permease subunit [Mollicutes bacterium LVI A0039]|nr:ABC transporter permease subunit [Mollicutes bacterium LVI A0039]